MINNSDENTLNNGEAQQNWEEKMNEPIGFVMLTPEQIEELRKQGYNV